MYFSFLSNYPTFIINSFFNSCFNMFQKKPSTEKITAWFFYDFSYF